MDNSAFEKGYTRILHLLLIYFFIGFFFDFGSTFYAGFIVTPPRYPNIGDISLLIWLLCTCVIFLKILHTLEYDKITPLICLFFFFLIYGEGIHVVGNSVQIKLWHMGYDDSLGLGLPPNPALPMVPSNIIPIFTFLYFCDEYLGHFFELLSFLMFFTSFYYSGFSTETIVIERKRRCLLISVVLLFGLYIAWNAIEGQSVDLLVATCVLMIAIKIYHHFKSNRQVNPVGKIFEYLFIAAFIYVVVWIALIGHFNSIPQFFDTIAPLFGVK